jgi:hypothetical protein
VTTILDVVCTHVHDAGSGGLIPGHAASLSETLKDNTYSQAYGVDALRYIFPVAVETYGRIGDKSKKTLRTLASRLESWHKDI